MNVNLCDLKWRELVTRHRNKNEMHHIMRLLDLQRSMDTETLYVYNYSMPWLGNNGNSNVFKNDTTRCSLAGIVFCGQLQILPMEENMNEYNMQSIYVCLTSPEYVFVVHTSLNLSDLKWRELITRPRNENEVHHNARLFDLQPSMGTETLYIICIQFFNALIWQQRWIPTLSESTRHDVPWPKLFLRSTSNIAHGKETTNAKCKEQTCVMSLNYTWALICPISNGEKWSPEIGTNTKFTTTRSYLAFSQAWMRRRYMYTTIQCLDLATAASSNALRNYTTRISFAITVFLQSTVLIRNL